MPFKDLIMTRLRTHASRVIKRCRLLMALRLARVGSRKLFAPVGVQRARIPMHARNTELVIGNIYTVHAQNNSKDVFTYQQSILFYNLVILKSPFCIPF